MDELCSECEEKPERAELGNEDVGSPRSPESPPMKPEEGRLAIVEAMKATKLRLTRTAIRYRVAGPGK